MAATLAAVGCCLFLHGRRALGAFLAALAALTLALVVLVVVPGLNPDGVYPYLSSVDGPSGDPVARLLMPGQKWVTLAVLLAPTAFLALRSPLLLLAVPTLGWRFWSTNPAYWGTSFPARQEADALRALASAGCAPVRGGGITVYRLGGEGV
ncbi:hypothetical protein ACFVSN_01250 [Kitasatospora sp. NPDC057904]|uniref:hypothetical protein n=1 Tax=unclassified Kitasatospora TaxID=2633591 RepID=UPI0036D81DB4